MSYRRDHGGKGVKPKMLGREKSAPGRTLMLMASCIPMASDGQIAPPVA